VASRGGEGRVDWPSHTKEGENWDRCYLTMREWVSLFFLKRGVTIHHSGTFLILERVDIYNTSSFLDKKKKKKKKKKKSTLFFF
jgi:hypothetical protein